MNDLLAGLNVRALFLAGGVLCVWLAYQFVAKRLTNEERLKEATSNIRWVIEDARRMRREVEKQHSIIELVRMLDLYNLQKSELDAKQQNQQKSLINSLEDLSPDSVHTKLRILIDEAKAEVTRVGALQQSEAANQQRKVITVLDSFSSAIDPTAAQLAELRRLIDEAKAEVTRVGAQQSEAANQQKKVITVLDSFSSAIDPTAAQLAELRRLIDEAKEGQELAEERQSEAATQQKKVITVLDSRSSAIDLTTAELAKLRKLMPEVTRVGAQQSEAATQQKKVITVLDSLSSAIDPTAAQLAELRRLIDEAKAEVTRVGAQQSEAATNQQKNVITSLDSLSSAIHPTVNQLRRLIDGAKAWVKRHAAEELSISQLALGRYRGQVLQHQQANAQTDQPPQQSATELQNTMITSLETLGSAIDIANTELESIKKNREPWRYYLAAVGVLFMAAFLFFCSAFFGKDGLRGLF
jgi:chromosome segregation ATPase